VTMGPVDIYIGGELPEDLAYTGVEFSNVSEYLETSEETAWTSIIVTPSDSIPSDTTILEYTANDIFKTGGSYLCILTHNNTSPESSYQMQIDYQPVF